MQTVAHEPIEHREEHHPSVRQYVIVGAILFAITAVEVALFYIPGQPSIIPPILFLLSAIKFGTVAAFFMHLRFDSKLFTVFFVCGLILGGSVIVALLALLGAFGGGSLPPVGAPPHA